MIRLTVVTLAALYLVLHFFGDEARRPDQVSRAEPPALGVVLADYLPAPDDTAQAVAVSRVSEEEAIRRALAAGAEIRAGRGGSLRSGAAPLSAIEEPAIQAAATDAPIWYVTGERVNLRGGPGTSNPVVGQVAFGDRAEVLGDRDGWYQIRLQDGSATGWIFGRFLDENRPG